MKTSFKMMLSCKLFVVLFLFPATLSLKVAKVDHETSNQRVIWDKVETELENKISQRGGLLLLAAAALLGNAKVDLTSNDFNNFTIEAEALNDQMSGLKSGRTLQETAELVDKNLPFPTKMNLPRLIKNSNSDSTEIKASGQVGKQLEEIVFNSIYRTLRFYDQQLGEIFKGDTVIALLVLKEIDDKHGRVFQKSFPLEKWMERVCSSVKRFSVPEGNFCDSLVYQWTKNSQTKTQPKNHWKSSNIIQKILNQTDNNILENIGDEKDGLWGTLNGQCQIGLVNRCEVPYVCERTLLDPTPRSQYLLTHQILQRHFVNIVECPNVKSSPNKKDMYEHLCAKAYMEARYLDALNVPILQRDLFAEYVGFCGYMGYPNFIRVDWLERILSWQSKSDNGCFLKDHLSPVGILTTDIGFKRKITKTELDAGILDSNEKCLPHLTAVNLIAVAIHWDYLMNLKRNQ